MGSSDLWFGLQPDRTVLQDGTFGYRSGLRPDIVVVDPMFRLMHEEYRQRDAALFLHVQRTLENSQLVCQDEHYRVYQTAR
jgi:hypothetical protein